MIMLDAGEIVKGVSFYDDGLPPFSQAPFKYPINSTGHSKTSHTCEGMSAAPVGRIFSKRTEKRSKHLRIGPVLDSRSIKVPVI